MTVQDESATTTHGVILTSAAAAKAKSLLDQEGRDDLALRIAVQPEAAPGCGTTCTSTTAPSMAISPSSSRASS